MKFLLIFVIFCMISCNSDLPVAPELNVNLKLFEAETTQLDSIAKLNMNGVYSVIEGKDIFGDEVAGKWVDRRWCLYANYDVVFSENAGGSSGDSLKFKGYYRIVRSGSGALLDMTIQPNEGSKELIQSKVPASLIIRGKTSGGKDIVLKKIRDLNPSKMFLMAHRGGGRNSERLGASENSLAMLKLAQYLGATGVEIDVKRTRDGRLILFHDDTFSPRTVIGSYLLGKVENFDLSQIQQFGKLINGEEIPTLEEALNTVVDSTILSLVWLDIKDPLTVDEAIRVQRNSIGRARSKNSNLLILLGIPTQEIMDAYNSSPLKNTTPILIEYDINLALSNSNCQAWAPRWTNEISPSDIQRVQDKKKFVFTWTLDYRDYISDFLNSKNIDGILSDYSSLVAGMVYSR